MTDVHLPYGELVYSESFRTTGRTRPKSKEYIVRTTQIRPRSVVCPMFFLLIPKITLKLEEELPNYIDKEKTRAHCKNIAESLLKNPLVMERFLTLDETQYKDLVERQIKLLTDTVNAELADDMEDNQIDITLAKLSRALVGWIQSISRTTTGVEDAMIATRRDWRANRTWLGNIYREPSEKVLLQLEELPSDKIIAFLSTLQKTLAQVEQDIEDLRSTEVVKLCYTNASKEFEEVRRETNLLEAVAILELNQETKAARLTYSDDASLVDKRTALRQAKSIVKSGTRIGDGRLIGMHYQLEITDKGNGESEEDS